MLDYFYHAEEGPQVFVHSRQGLHHGTTSLWPCSLLLNVVHIELGTIHREFAMCQAEY